MTREKELDLLLAELFASVHTFWDPEARRTKMCFSHEELSVYFFYMSMAQIVVSKHGFLEAFLAQVDPRERRALTRALYSQQLTESYMDNQFERGDLALQEDPAQSAKTYSFIVNSQLDELFREQRSRSLGPSGKFSKIMGYLGISRSSMLGLTKDTFYNAFMANVAIALLAFVGLSTGSLLLVALVTTFLCYLSDYVLGMLAKLSGPVEEMSNHFLAFVGSIFKKLDGHDDFTLDYDELFQPLRDGNGSSLLASLKFSAQQQLANYSVLYDTFSSKKSYYLEYSEAAHRRLI